jgi:hypothetical protein
MTLDVKKSNSSNVTPNVMTVGVEKYGLRVVLNVKKIAKVSINLLTSIDLPLNLKEGW